MSYAKGTQAAGRHIFPDLARAWALIGICVVNVGAIAYPMVESYYLGGLDTPADKNAYFLVNALFSFKSYTLFSFMFGVGFAYQIASAERAGAQFGSRYWRRIIGLVAFGAFNILFCFQGDILVVYAILGALLFAFKDLSPKVLIRWGIGLYIIQILILAALAGMMELMAAYAPDAMAEQDKVIGELVDAERAAFTSSSLLDAIIQRAVDWGFVIGNALFAQGFGVLSFFTFGLAAVKNGLIADPTRDFWRRARWFYFPAGLAISTYGAWQMAQGASVLDPKSMWGMAIVCIGAPFSTAGYLGVLAKWAEGNVGPIKAFFARGGTSSLTAYLMQGFLLSLIFYGYGFGYFEKLGAAPSILIAFGVGLFTIIFASLWRTKFKRGPAEILLRNWTYGDDKPVSTQ